jgi:hypothetical protein
MFEEISLAASPNLFGWYLLGIGEGAIEIVPRVETL